MTFTSLTVSVSGSHGLFAVVLFVTFFFMIFLLSCTLLLQLFIVFLPCFPSLATWLSAQAFIKTISH